VCLCVRTITFERNDLRPKYMERWSSFTLYGSSSNVLRSSSREQEKMLLKWLARPRVGVCEL